MILGWNKTYGINNNVVKLIIANNLIVYRFTRADIRKLLPYFEFETVV